MMVSALNNLDGQTAAMPESRSSAPITVVR